MSSSDPKPWLVEGASPELRALLDSARMDDPSQKQLSNLAMKMAPLLVLPAAAAAPAAATAGTAAGQAAVAGKTTAGVVAAAKTGIAVKVLVTAGAVAAVGGAFEAGRVYEDKVAPPKKVLVVPKPIVVPEAPVVVPEPEPEPVVEPEPEPVPEPVKPAPRPQVVKPEAEAAMLESAMNALKANEWAKALSLCERHAREVGAKGLLVQEREVIAIEALMRLGRTSEAKARAEKFKRAFPTSTHLLKVESLVGG